MKRCTKCGREKPLEDFYVQRRVSCGRQPICKRCAKDNDAERHAANPQRRSASNAAWYSANTERHKANGERWRRENSESIKRRIRRWRDENPERQKAQVRRYRAAKNGSIREEYFDIEIFERDGWTCQICGNPIDPNLQSPNPLSASIDHFWPISRQGPDIRANVLAAHRRCNGKKTDNMPNAPMQLWLIFLTAVVIYGIMNHAN